MKEVETNILVEVWLVSAPIAVSVFEQLSAADCRRELRVVPG